MICFIHGSPYGLTTQKDPAVNASLPLFPGDAAAVLRTGPTVMVNNRFIRLVILLPRAGWFANLLAGKSRYNFEHFEHD
jgi:hypothetical protein